MTFQITKQARQFSSLLPKAPFFTKAFLPKQRSYLPVSIQTLRPLQTRSVQTVQTIRAYSTRSTDDIEPDLYSPPTFINSPQSTIEPHEQTILIRGQKILRHILVTFEAHHQELDKRKAGPQVIKELLSKHFFNNKLEFAEHLIHFFESLDPLKTTGMNLIRAIKAYADCRATIIKQDRTTQSFQYNNPFLTMLPPEITLLKKLETLDLSDNALKFLPSIFFDRDRLLFPSLLSLNLNQNRISSLGALLNQCPKLKVLNLRGNHMQHLPEAFYSLKSLKDLDLSDNQLQHIPPQLFALSLTHLNLSQNHLRELPSLFYDDISYQQGTGDSKLFHTLLHLNLSHNLIERFISYKAFPNLKTLNLANNQLEFFHLYRFRNPALQSLDLHANKITRFHCDPRNLGYLALKKLDLSYNPVHAIASELLKEIPQVHRTPVNRPSPSDMIGC